MWLLAGECDCRSENSIDLDNLSKSLSQGKSYYESARVFSTMFWLVAPFRDDHAMDLHFIFPSCVWGLAVE